jgi:peptidoglycan/xylan/chitin deacetylase (PgdA/CDA1 family)
MIRNPIPWPDGARCAVAITFDMDADSILHLAHHEQANNKVMTMSMLRYDPEVAVPRLVDMFAEFGIKQTFFLPAWCIERYPATVELILEGGHEIGHHGYLHEHPNELPPEEELYWFDRSIDAIVKATGQPPRGFRAPSYRFSAKTLDFLVQRGLSYDASLMGDDIPYLLDNGEGRVVELPSHYAMDDWAHFMVARDLGYMMPIKAPSHGMDVVREEFDAAWRYGGLWISVWHPMLMGRLARAAALADLIAHMQHKGKVWFAKLEDIATHVKKVVADGSWNPRVDRLPYYPGPIPELPRKPK